MGTAINGYDITKAYGQFRIEQKDGTVTVYNFLENCVPLKATLEYEQLDVGREINLRLLYCGPEEPLQTTTFQNPLMSLAVHENAECKAVILNDKGPILVKRLNEAFPFLNVKYDWVSDSIVLESEFLNPHSGGVLLVRNDDSLQYRSKEIFDKNYTVLDEKDFVLTVVRDTDMKRVFLLTTDQKTRFVKEALELLPVGFDALGSKRGVYFEREGKPDFYIENGQYLTFDEYDKTGESYRVMTPETFDDEWIYIKDKDI